MNSFSDKYARSGRSERNRHTSTVFLSCVVLGGLAIAGTMLFPAPQSWKKARAKPHPARLDVPGQPARSTGDTVIQSRVDSHQVSEDAQNQAKGRQQPGKVTFTRLKDRVVTRVGPGTNR